MATTVTDRYSGTAASTSTDRFTGTPSVSATYRRSVALGLSGGGALKLSGDAGTGVLLLSGDAAALSASSTLTSRLP